MIKPVKSIFTLILSGITLFLSAQEFLPEHSGYLKNEGWKQWVSPVVDSLGNIIMAGSFEGKLTIGDQKLKTRGKRDLFIASISPEGTRQWVKTFYGSGYPGSLGILLDKNQQITLLGFFNDSLSNPDIQWIRSGRNHLFFIKLDLTGNILRSGILLPDCKGHILDFAKDTSGNFILTGTFKKRITLGDREFHTKGKEDVFVVKISSEGTVQNAKVFGGPGADKPTGLIAAGEGYMLYGNFEKTIQAGDSTLVSTGNSDAFILNLDSALTVRNAFAYGGPKKDEIISVQLDQGGNIYASGTFRDQLRFGNSILISNGLSDLYMLKLDSQFDPLLCRSWGGPSDDRPASLIIDGSDRLFLSGRFKKEIYLGIDTLKTEDRFSDAFLCMMNDTGAVNWCKQFSGRSEENALFLINYDPDRILFAASFFYEILAGQESVETKSSPGLFWALFLDPCSLLNFNLPSEKYLCKGASDTIDAGPGYSSYLWNGGASDRQSMMVADTGLYSVQITDQYGCKASDTIKVTGDSVRLSYVVQNEILPQGNNGRIDVELVSGYPPYQILWNNGATTLSLDGLAEGNYSIFVSDSLNCKNYSDIEVGSTVTSGILDIFNFPNPVDDLTRIIYSLPENSWMELALFDVKGRKIWVFYNGKKKQGKYGFDWHRGELGDGIYYLRLSTTEKTITKKMIIDHK